MQPCPLIFSFLEQTNFGLMCFSKWEDESEVVSVLALKSLVARSSLVAESVLQLASISLVFSKR